MSRHGLIWQPIQSPWGARQALCGRRKMGEIPRAHHFVTVFSNDFDDFGEGTGLMATKSKLESKKKEIPK